uniref:Uncharacterized protein n=1 Tax=Trieres chinensis TaxID=1514140 RepID=A0A7S2EBU0_TRICV|mmetsp:Transcript_16722/g.34252  ORF Transcript_16722/g.34252 Transcript_16722/m.34252 type:complete len:182 (+) Transcript_16722:140-685(+)
MRGLVRAGLQSASIMTVADVATQFFVEGRSFPPTKTTKLVAEGTLHYDPSRTLRWTAAGLVIHGPYFFASMSRVDAFFGPATSFLNVAKKTAFAQFVVFPPYLVALFASMGWMEGCDDVREKVVSRVPEAFLGGCAFWPVANAINFSFVPGSMRVPYLAGVGSLWNCFLSWLNAREGSGAN